MPLQETTKTNTAFKKLVGKAQTDHVKEFFNEAKGSAPSVFAGFIPALDIPATPTISSLYSITNSGGFQAVEFLRCPLVADPTSNGHAFFVQLPSNYSINSNSSKKGTAPWVSGQNFCDTAGKVQAVPPMMGLNYEAKLWAGGSESVLGSGTWISGGDARNWILDYFNGILYQEVDNSSPTPTFVELLVYIGPVLSEGGSGGGGLPTTTYPYSGAGLSGGRLVTKVGGEIVYADKTMSYPYSNALGILINTVSSGGFAIVQSSGYTPDGLITASEFVEGILPATESRVWLSTNGLLTVSPPVELTGHWMETAGIWDGSRLNIQLSFLGSA